MTKPLYGHVPSDPPPLDEEPPKKKMGWPKGKPRKNALVQLPPPAIPEGGCGGCGRPLAELSLPLVAELVRVSRDRIIEQGQQATLDMLYLAARVDGYCSLGCWRHHGASEDQTQKLDQARPPA